MGEPGAGGSRSCLLDVLDQPRHGKVGGRILVHLPIAKLRLLRNQISHRAQTVFEKNYLWRGLLKLSPELELCVDGPFYDARSWHYRSLRQLYFEHIYPLAQTFALIQRRRARGCRLDNHGVLSRVMMCGIEPVVGRIFSFAFHTRNRRAYVYRQAHPFPWADILDFSEAHDQEDCEFQETAHLEHGRMYASLADTLLSHRWHLLRLRDRFEKDSPLRLHDYAPGLPDVERDGNWCIRAVTCQGNYHARRFLGVRWNDPVPPGLIFARSQLDPPLTVREMSAFRSRVWKSYGIKIAPNLLETMRIFPGGKIEFGARESSSKRWPETLRILRPDEIELILKLSFEPGPWVQKGDTTTVVPGYMLKMSDALDRKLAKKGLIEFLDGVQGWPRGRLPLAIEEFFDEELEREDHWTDKQWESVKMLCKNPQRKRLYWVDSTGDVRCEWAPNVLGNFSAVSSIELSVDSLWDENGRGRNFEEEDDDGACEKYVKCEINAILDNWESFVRAQRDALAQRTLYLEKLGPFAGCAGGTPNARVGHRFRHSRLESSFMWSGSDAWCDNIRWYVQDSAWDRFEERLAEEDYDRRWEAEREAPARAALAEDTLECMRLWFPDER